MKKDKMVVEEIVNYMQQKIADGSWPLGAKIPSENTLCAELGVGRGSIRSALQRFIVLGILESQHGRGTFVRSTDMSLFGKVNDQDAVILDNLITIRQARAVIEPEIAYKAAIQATPELIDCLNSLSEQLKSAVGNQELFIKLDAQFHMALAESMKNPIIFRIMNELLEQTVCMNINRIFGYYGGLYYHQRIANAIAQHNADLAHSTMKEHLESELFNPLDKKER